MINYQILDLYPKLFCINNRYRKENEWYQRIDQLNLPEDTAKPI